MSKNREPKEHFDIRTPQCTWQDAPLNLLMTSIHYRTMKTEPSAPLSSYYKDRHIIGDSRFTQMRKICVASLVGI